MCPLCKGELACGWWCNNCKMTKSNLHYQLALQKMFEAEPPWGLLIFFLVTMIVFVAIVLTHR